MIRRLLLIHRLLTCLLAADLARELERYIDQLLAARRTGRDVHWLNLENGASIAPNSVLYLRINGKVYAVDVEDLGAV